MPLMTLGPDPFAARYAGSSESELLAVARDYDSLIEPAQAALRAEFARRGLEPPLVADESDEPVQRQLITLRQYRDLSEAIVARTMLEAAGIPVYLRDENLVRLDWQVSNFIGGIRLQVEDSDAQAATELLNQPVSEFISLDDGVAFEQPHCPHCDSLEISFEGAGRALAITSTFLFGIPLPLGRKSWVCNDCGTRWEETTSPA